MEKFEVREHVTIENQGQKIFGVLHRPLHAKKSPAVLICHGFAGNKLGKYRIYVLLAERLAKEGIASLRIDFRGSGESEGNFNEMTVESEISDALKGLEFLRARSDIDANRIGVLGNSFGGAIAVMTAHADGNIKSLVLLAALFHSLPWKQQWEKLHATHADDSSRKELARILDGNVPGPAFYPGFFQLNVKLALESLDSVPLLHIHSERDDRVDLEQAQQYKHCRQNAKSMTRWINLTKCDHDFSNMEERLMVVEEAAKWFAKTL